MSAFSHERQHVTHKAAISSNRELHLPASHSSFPGPMACEQQATHHQSLPGCKLCGPPVRQGAPSPACLSFCTRRRVHGLEAWPEDPSRRHCSLQTSELSELVSPMGCKCSGRAMATRTANSRNRRASGLLSSVGRRPCAFRHCWLLQRRLSYEISASFCVPESSQPPVYGLQHAADPCPL